MLAYVLIKRKMTNGGDDLVKKRFGAFHSRE
jgi:hypothetical protein